MKRVFTLCLGLAVAIMCGHSHADLVITGVIDGDLSGGNPKAVILTATSDIADLSDWGAGSANNGTGTDGVELTFSGSITSGQQIIITNSGDSTAFFDDCFTDDFIFFQGAPAFINGDDAVELFNNVSTTATVFDVYGDPDTNGDGETWDYTDGYAVRIGGGPSVPFNQANFNSVFQGLDGLDADQHKAEFARVFGFTPVPEPSSMVVLAAFGMMGLRRRK